MYAVTQNEDTVFLHQYFDMELTRKVKKGELLQADERVREDIGKVCVARGPLIYCAEEADNGDLLDHLVVDARTSFAETPDQIGNQRIVRLTAQGWRRSSIEKDDLYHRYRPTVYRETEISFIPYFTWANRGENEMKVWLTVR